LQRHEINDLDNTGWSQERINQELLKFGEKYNVKVIATNDSHYVDQKDMKHMIFYCVYKQEKISLIQKDSNFQTINFFQDTIRNERTL
jgi:DNA polymerase-3 subunit alpha